MYEFIISLLTTIALTIPVGLVASQHSFEASESIVHDGVNFPSVSFFQPQSPGLERDGIAISAFPQT